MKANHMSPGEAVQAFKDCGAGLMVPMHYETFNLSNEAMTAPRKMLLQLTRGKNLSVTKPGETIMI